jgi:hypothetical protein
MPYTDSHTIHSDPDFPHAYYGDSAVLEGLDVDRAAKLLSLVGPGAAAPCVLQLGHLGGALSRPAPNAVPHREGRFPLRLLTGGGRDAARAVLDPAFALLADATLGRSLNFAFGAGDRGAGLYGPETRERLAGLQRRHDPANLLCGNYGVSAC